MILTEDNCELHIFIGDAVVDITFKNLENKIFSISIYRTAFNMQNLEESLKILRVNSECPEEIIFSDKYVNLLFNGRKIQFSSSKHPFFSFECLLSRANMMKLLQEILIKESQIAIPDFLTKNAYFKLTDGRVFELIVENMRPKEIRESQKTYQFEKIIDRQIFFWRQDGAGYQHRLKIPFYGTYPPWTGSFNIIVSDDNDKEHIIDNFDYWDNWSSESQGLFTMVTP